MGGMSAEIEERSGRRIEERGDGVSGLGESVREVARWTDGLSGLCWGVDKAGVGALVGVLCRLGDWRWWEVAV